MLATITVNTTGDADSRNAELSFREALEISNGTLAITALSAEEQAQVDGALATPNTIAFHIPGSGIQTIFPTEALPTITSPVVIDGYTQPGSHPNTLASGMDAVVLIQISGWPTISSTGQSVAPFGLDLAADDSTVQGLAINRYGFQVRVSGQGNVIKGT